MTTRMWSLIKYVSSGINIITLHMVVRLLKHWNWWKANTTFSFLIGPGRKKRAKGIKFLTLKIALNNQKLYVIFLITEHQIQPTSS